MHIKDCTIKLVYGTCSFALFQCDCIQQHCNKFVVTVDYLKGISYPVVYEIDLETEKVKKCKMQPSIVLYKKMINTGINSDRMQIRWAKKDISRGQCFGFEWK